MKLIIFEDSDLNGLLPFSFNHSPIELRLGAFTNLERFQRLYNNLDIILIVRKDLEDFIKERYPDLVINPQEISEGICLNSSVILALTFNDKIKKIKIQSNFFTLIFFFPNIIK